MNIEISPNLLKTTSKGVIQLILIYLFVFMTAFDSQKLNGTTFNKILDSPISHFGIIFGIYYTMNPSASVGISVVVAGIITAVFLLFQIIEFMDSKLKLIEKSTSVDPKVRDITAIELLEYFDNDINVFRKALKESNLPEDSILNDYTAPEIATKLLYSGHKLV